MRTIREGLIEDFPKFALSLVLSVIIVGCFYLIVRYTK